jgi:hypothetical protein
MNREKFKALCVKAVVAAVTTSGLLALGTQTASAQAITVAVPFAFSAGNHNFPVGTYQFTLLSGWTLSIRSVEGGGERFFTVRPKENGLRASRTRIVFRNSGGQKNLKAVYIPELNEAVELSLPAQVSPKLKSLAQNATLR